MKLNTLKVLFKIVVIVFAFQANLTAQTYVLKAEPTEDFDNMVLTNTIKENQQGRHFKNRLIYIGDNKAYYTLIPYLRNKTDSLLYTYPNVPTFTYLKNLDLIVEKLKGSIKIHSKTEFNNKFGYEATNEFKNYHGTQVQKYVSKGNFYEMYFWVAENETSKPENDFIHILRTIGLINLASHKKIVAINYLGSEFPIAYMKISHKSRQSINKEVYRDIESSMGINGEKSKELYEPVTDFKEIKHLLKKAYTFNYIRLRSGTDVHYKSNTSESKMYFNKNNNNTIEFVDNKFFALIDGFLLEGRVDDDGELRYEKSKKLAGKQKKLPIDLSNFKLIYLNKEGNTLDFCVQSKNEFWNFIRYKFVPKIKDLRHLNTDLKLPNGEEFVGVVKNVYAFYAGYKNSHYEYSTSLSDFQKLNTNLTYVIKE